MVVKIDKNYIMDIDELKDLCSDIEYLSLGLNSISVFKMLMKIRTK